MPLENTVATELLTWGVWDLPEDGLDFQQLKTAHAGARELYEDFHAKAGELRGSGRYSEAGLRQELTAVARESLERLGELEANLVVPREARLQAMKQNLTSFDPPTAAEAMRSRELRDFLLGLSREERLQAVHMAAGEADQETLTAVVRAPLPLRRALGLDARLLGELEDALFVARADAQTLEAYRRLGKALELARQSLAAAEAKMRGEVGLPPREAAEATVSSKTQVSIEEGLVVGGAASSSAE